MAPLPSQAPGALEPLGAADYACVRSNIAHALWRAARLAPGHRALISCPPPAVLGPRGETVVASFAKVQQGAARLAGALLGHGVGPGSRVLVMLLPGVEFVAAMFAVAACGATAVLVDPGMGLGAMMRCVADSRPAVVLAESAFHWAARAMGALPPDALRVSRGWAPGTLSWQAFETQGQDCPLVEPVDATSAPTCVLAFTSGSTGVPKAVVMTHAILAAQLEAMHAIHPIAPGGVQAAFVPLGVLLGPGLMCTTLVPGVHPRKLDRLDGMQVLGEFREHGVTHCFAGPFVWERIARALHATGSRLPLACAYIGGANPTADLVTRLCARIDGAVFVAYGATEAVPIAAVRAAEFLEQVHASEARGGCLVGRPVPGIEVTVGMTQGANAHRAARQGERGEVLVRGPMVSPGYDQVETDRHRVTLDGETWHRMGDCGYLDAKGRLTLCGRISEVVRAAGKDFYPLEVEPPLAEHPGVRQIALVQAGPGRAALVVAPRHGQDCGRLARELREMAAASGLAPAGLEVLFRPRLPVDVRHRAKILRGELARWAARQIGERAQ